MDCQNIVLLKKWCVLFSCTDLFYLKQPKLSFPLGIHIIIYHPPSSIHPWQTQDKTHLSIIKSLQILHIISFAEFLGCGLNECVFEAVILTLSIRRAEGLDMAGRQWRKGFPSQKSEGFGHISRCWNITFSI